MPAPAETPTPVAWPDPLGRLPRGFAGLVWGGPVSSDVTETSAVDAREDDVGVVFGVEVRVCCDVVDGGLARVRLVAAGRERDGRRALDSGRLLAAGYAPRDEGLWVLERDGTCIEVDLIDGVIVMTEELT